MPNNNTKPSKRKNITGLQVTWPPQDNYFMVKDLFNLNPTGKKITLRVRLSKAIEKNTVAKIGTMAQPKGAPCIVYAFTPLSQSVLDKADKDGVMILSRSELVKVLDITPKSPSPTEIPSVAIKATAEGTLVNN